MLEELLKKEVSIVTFSPSSEKLGAKVYFGKVIGVNEEYLVLDCYESKYVFFMGFTGQKNVTKINISNIDKSKPKKIYLRRTFIASIEVIE